MSLTASALIFQSTIESGVDVIISNLTLTILLYVTVFIINVVTKGQITTRISKNEVLKTSFTTLKRKNIGKIPFVID